MGFGEKGTGECLHHVATLTDDVFARCRHRRAFLVLTATSSQSERHG